MGSSRRSSKKKYSARDDDYSHKLDDIFNSLQPMRRTEGFFVEQHWEVIEQVCSCYEQNNNYTVHSLKHADRNEKGSIQFLEAKEKTSCFSRIWCGENRGFSFMLEDTETGKVIFEFSRMFRCCGWALIPGCAHSVEVHNLINEKESVETGKPVVYASSSTSNQIARVRAPYGGGCLIPTFYLETYDPKVDDFVYRGYIQGNSCWFCPCVVCDCCGASFFVYDKDNKEIAAINKKGVGTYKELWLETMTESDKYAVSFSNKQLSFNMKLAILAAVFQIDFNFFEDSRSIAQFHCCDLFCCGYALPCLPLCCLAACCAAQHNKDKNSRSKREKGSPFSAIMDR